MTAFHDPLAVFLQFANGLAVALVLAFVAIVFRNKLQIKSVVAAKVFDGAVFGVIGIAVMFFPVQILPGAALDVRVVPVVLAGPFGGPAAAIIAGLIVGGYRLYLGGPGVVAGTGAILTVAALGAFIAVHWEEKARRFGVGHLLLIGMGLVAATLGWTLILPAELVPISLRTFTLPVLISHPLGVVVLGLLLIYETRRQHTETALRESEARLRAIVENSSAGIYLKDTEGRYVLANEEFLKRFGLSREDLIGKTAANFRQAEIASRIAEQDRDIVENRRAATFEFETDYADGTIHWEMNVKFPVIDAFGALAGIGGISADITQWKRAEETARRSEAQFREFFEKAELVFLTVAPGGQVVNCNGFLLRLTGHRRVEVIGTDWFDTFIPPEEREMIRRMFQETMREGHLVIPPHFENDILTRSGAPRTIAWDNAIVRDPDGLVHGMTSVGVDITERKRAIATIRTEKDRAERYLSIAGTLIIALDREGTITLINRKCCEVLEYAQGDLIGRNWFDTVVPADARDKVRAILLRMLHDGGEAIPQFENEIETKSGRRRLIVWHNSVLRDENGDVTGGLSSGIDITDQRRAEEEASNLRDKLAHVARLSTMGEMATGFAHELNQPLAAINNYAKGALRRLQKIDTPGRDELIDAMNKLAEQAERAGDVIRRIRWFVQKNAPQTTAIDINNAIRHTVELFRDDVLRHDVLLDLDLAGSLPDVQADGIQIQQVILNLCRNGMEAMDACPIGNRRLTIRTRRGRGNAVEITVDDTGPGLAPEIGNDLFEPFITTKPDGMGIGLSICRSIVVAHGGILSAKSSKETGTTFQFTLPTIDPPSPSPRDT